MKKMFCLFACLLVMMTMLPTAYADTPLLADSADLLYPNDEQDLLTLLEEVSSRHSLDVAVLTCNGTENGMSTRDYCEYFFEQNYGVGAELDGVILCVNMAEREWHIATSGKAITAITDYGLEHIEDEMLSYLSNGYYYKAFAAYANACDELLAIAEQGEPYDIYNSDEYFGYGTASSGIGVLPKLGISAAAGLVVGLIWVTVLKSQLTSVTFQKAASSYIKPGSMRLTQRKDIFLYRNVSKTRRPQDTSSSSRSGGGSSVHRSSSGHSFGGRGGKF